MIIHCFRKNQGLEVECIEENKIVSELLNNDSKQKETWCLQSLGKGWTQGLDTAVQDLPELTQDSDEPVHFSFYNDYVVPHRVTQNKTLVV